MSSEGSDTGWNYSAKGTTGQKVIVAILLIFPMLIFGIKPIYNVDKPTLLGLPFFLLV